MLREPSSTHLAIEPASQDSPMRRGLKLQKEHFIRKIFNNDASQDSPMRRGLKSPRPRVR